jgi:hypothetical protein
MKHGATTYWLDKRSIHRRFEFHLRWDKQVLHDNTYTYFDRKDRSTVQATSAAVISDSIGFGAELLPRSWELWYHPALRRFCVSLWFLAFWFDFSNTPLWNRTKKVSKLKKSSQTYDDGQPVWTSDGPHVMVGKLRPVSKNFEASVWGKTEPNRPVSKGFLEGLRSQGAPELADRIEKSQSKNEAKPDLIDQLKEIVSDEPYIADVFKDRGIDLQQRTKGAKEPGAKRCHVKCNNGFGCLDESEESALRTSETQLQDFVDERTQRQEDARKYRARIAELEAAQRTKEASPESIEARVERFVAEHPHLAGNEYALKALLREQPCPQSKREPRGMLDPNVKTIVNTSIADKVRVARDRSVAVYNDPKSTIDDRLDAALTYLDVMDALEAKESKSFIRCGSDCECDAWVAQQQACKACPRKAINPRPPCSCDGGTELGDGHDQSCQVNEWFRKLARIQYIKESGHTITAEDIAKVREGWSTAGHKATPYELHELTETQTRRANIEHPCYECGAKPWYACVELGVDMGFQVHPSRGTKQ